MNKEQAEKLLAFMVDSYSGFYVKPEKAALKWSNVLGDYEKREVYEALQQIQSVTDEAPGPNMIKDVCIRRRKEAFQRESFDEVNRNRYLADRSLDDVPGNCRAAKVMHVVTEQAAKQWLQGEYNEFFGDILIAGKEAGIVFEGIDYDRIITSGESLAGGLVAMVKQSGMQ